MEEILKVLPELSDEVREKIEQAFAREYEKGRADVEKEQTASAFEEGVESALSLAGAFDLKLARSVLDLENVFFENGEFLGLDEEIAEAKNKYAFLFRQDIPQFTGVGPSDEFMDFSKLNYLERLKLYRENPENYRRFRE